MTAIARGPELLLYVRVECFGQIGRSEARHMGQVLYHALRLFEGIHQTSVPLSRGDPVQRLPISRPLTREQPVRIDSPDAYRSLNGFDRGAAVATVVGVHRPRLDAQTARKVGVAFLRLLKGEEPLGGHPRRIFGPPTFFSQPQLTPRAQRSQRTVEPAPVRRHRSLAQGVIRKLY